MSLGFTPSKGFDDIGSQLGLDQEQIRRNTFLFQSTENVVLLYMVVVITFSGVMLAGVQFIASYKLAASGRGTLPGESKISYSPSSGKMSFKSSVIGLTILAFSFVFFLVFVKDIYPLKELASTTPAQSDTGASRYPITLLPYPSTDGASTLTNPADFQVPDKRSTTQSPEKSGGLPPIKSGAHAELRGGHLQSNGAPHPSRVPSASCLPSH
jgi:hypothetical protein